MDLLPIFPLSLIVVPQESINLHIFEPRYKQLINEAEHLGITFGIPTMYNGKLRNIFAELELLEVVDRLEDGRMNITVKGIGMVQMHKFYDQMPGKLYPGAEIVRIESDYQPYKNKNVECITLINELYSILNVNNVQIPNSDNFRSWSLIHKLGLSVEQELSFIEIDNEAGRIEFIIQHLNNFIPIMKQMNQIKERANLNGHFKNLNPLF